MTESVFGISHDERVIWQIERIPQTGTDPVNYYVGLTLNLAGPGSLSATNWNGSIVDIDVRSGKVLRTRWGR